MFDNPSLMTRIAVGKAIGFGFGLVGFILLPYLLPDADWMLRFGVLFWYSTMGSIIGVYGVITRHPLFELPMPWWLRSISVGGWMNFVLVLFTYDKLQIILSKLFGSTPLLSSPFIFVIEGAAVGLVMGYFATLLGGEGKEVVDR